MARISTADTISLANWVPALNAAVNATDIEYFEYKIWEQTHSQVLMDDTLVPFAMSVWYAVYRLNAEMIFNCSQKG